MRFQTYDEMDITLAKLHSPSLVSNETKVLGPFGVFQGVKMPPKKTKGNKRKRKNENLTSALIKRQSTNDYSSVTKPSPLSNVATSSQPEPVSETDATVLPEFPLSTSFSTEPGADFSKNVNSKSSPSIHDLQDTSIPANFNFSLTHNTQLDPALMAHDKLNDDIGAIISNLQGISEPHSANLPIGLFDINNNDNAVITELNQFSALHGDTDLASINLDDIVPELQNWVSMSNVSIDLSNLKNLQNNGNDPDNATANSDLGNQSIVDSINKLLANKNNMSNTLNMDFANNLLANDRKQSNATKFGMNGSKHSHSVVNGSNNINSQLDVSSSNENNNDQGGMVMVPATSIINNFLSTDSDFGIPTNSLYFSPEARHLLHYYIRHVVRLMTVVTHDSTPWKTVYLPRAINAIGCLTALGSTSPARNTVLHALLSVSSFHLASKYPADSSQRTHFTEVGAKLKNHAVNFLKLCPVNPPSIPVVDNEHKDLITAVLSMVTIGVVSSDTSSCPIYIRYCRKHIYAQLRNSYTKNTKETQILHRIYAFLNLMQDSTNITPDRLDSSVFDGPGWNTAKEVESLGLNSVVSTNKGSRNNSIFSNTFMESPGLESETSGSPGQGMFNSIFDTKFPNDERSKSLLSATDKGFGQEPGNTFGTGPNAESPKTYYDSEILSTYSMYGIPDSLTLLFHRVVKMARQRSFLMSHNVTGQAELKQKFQSDCVELDGMLNSWLFDFHETQVPPEFTHNTKKAFILHTIAFYHSLCIYHYTIVRDVPSEKLQDTVRLVLKYLQDMLQFNRNTSSPMVVPLLFPAFIAACEATEGKLAKQFDEWFDQMCIDGLGTYSQVRKVVKEVWRRRSLGKTNCRWYQVLGDMGINLLLT